MERVRKKIFWANSPRDYCIGLSDEELERFRNRIDEIRNEREHGLKPVRNELRNLIEERYRDLQSHR